jgi:L,D-transpeptidase catalytic domain
MRVLRAGLGLACAVGAAGGAAPAAPAADGAHRTVRPLSVHEPLGNERLSDEQRLSRYASAVTRAPVRALPSTSATQVGRLHYLTEDGPLEVYPVLESHIDRDGRAWLRIRLPMRPNGRTGWVPRNDLGPLQAVRTMLRVNRALLRATLYRDGRPIWSSPVGVGKASTPTPAGHFWIRSRLRGLRDDPVYGPYAFGTGAYSVLSDWPGGGVIGIHGTDRPQLIPGRPSHGCIRVPNAAITQLRRLMPIGTPVAIL